MIFGTRLKGKALGETAFKSVRYRRKLEWEDANDSKNRQNDYLMIRTYARMSHFNENAHAIL